MKWLFLAQLNSEFSIRGPWIHPPSWRQAMASFGLKWLRLEHPTMTRQVPHCWHSASYTSKWPDSSVPVCPSGLTVSHSRSCVACVYCLRHIEAAGAPGLRKSWRGGELEQLSRSTWSWLSNVGHHYCRNRPCTVLP